MRRSSRGYRPLATINVTPLVDVMLVLLIVFLVTASLAHEGVTVDLPSAQGSAPADTLALTVTLAADGLWVGTEKVEPEGLAAAVSTRLEASPDKTIEFRADRSVPYGDFVRVVAVLQALGAEQLILVTAPDGP